MLFHKDTRELDNQGWSWRPLREAEAYAAVSRLGYLRLDVHGLVLIDEPPYDQFRESEKTALELTALECCCDVETIIGDLRGSPHARSGWPAEGYVPGRTWERGPCPEDPPEDPPGLGTLTTSGLRGKGRHEVDVLELFAGCASLTRACLAAGMKVASVLDILYQSYGRAWDFSRQDPQADVAYLVVFVLRPKVVHLGLQCRDYCSLGRNQPTPESEACVEFAGMCAAHQELCGL